MNLVNFDKLQQHFKISVKRLCSRIWFEVGLLLANNYIHVKGILSSAAYLAKFAKRQSDAERSGKPPPRKPSAAWDPRGPKYLI